MQHLLVLFRAKLLLITIIVIIVYIFDYNNCGMITIKVRICDPQNCTYKSMDLQNESTGTRFPDTILATLKILLESKQ